MKKIILVKGAVETLEFFSAQMAGTFAESGLEVMTWDMTCPLESREQFESFYVKGETGFLTFNFIGLSDESQFSYGGESLWEHYGIPCFCIMVDHPMYYYKQLKKSLSNLTLACIDGDHVRFVKKYYPEYPVYFLPLAGTCINPKPLPISERHTDILFCGNFVALQDLTHYTRGLDQEYIDFYRNIVDDLIDHPQKTMEKAMTEALHREIPDIGRDDLLSCLYHMIYIDLAVRSEFRNRLICRIAEAGLEVTIVGKDWEKSDCLAPEKLHLLGERDSRYCLQAMQEAKISLNLMPWFKDGAHDRIFNSMLSGCVSVSDDSAYLRKLLTDGEDYVNFPLGDFAGVPNLLRELLADEGRMQAIADRGYALAGRGHTWKDRACEILTIWKE